MGDKNEVEKQLALEKFSDEVVPKLVEKVGYSELYGYDLTKAEKKVYTVLITKFLVANKYDITGATNQLEKTLKWRKKFNPLSAGFLEETDIPELSKLGLVTAVPESEQVITWNLYGAVKDRSKVFGNLDKFLRWRVGLMERGISLLDFSNQDTSFISQVHDYNNVSFLRLDAETKAASKATIEIFKEYYPELLSQKYFVNVPTIMGWVFGFVKQFLSKETVTKFHVITNGSDLAKDLGSWAPKAYGGKSTKSLEELALTKFEPKNPDLVRTES